MSTPHLQFAQKAVIVNDDRVLLLRKSCNDPNYPGWWDLPGGRMKDSEGLDAHLRREVLEETGLEVSVGSLIHLWDWFMDWHGESVRVLAVSRYCELEGTAADGPQHEVDDYLCEQRWIPRSDLLSLEIIPSQVATIERVVKQQEG